MRESGSSAASSTVPDAARVPASERERGRVAVSVHNEGIGPTHAPLPPPSAAEGGPRVSEDRERGARLPKEAEQMCGPKPLSASSLPSPDPLRGPPSPAEGGGKTGAVPEDVLGWPQIVRLGLVQTALGSVVVLMTPPSTG